MKKGVHSYLIERLQEGSSPTALLIRRTSVACTSTSQSVYKELSKLRRENIVTISKGNVSLSLLYIEREREKWQFAHLVATSQKEFLQKLNRNKTKITFAFKNQRELDLFWTHSFTILAVDIPNNIPRYMVTPHDFFLYTNPETDTFWIKKNITDHHISRLIVPFANNLDKKVLRKRKHLLGTRFDFLLNKNPLNQKEYIYINLIGEYIFTGKMDASWHKDFIRLLENFKEIPSTKKDFAAIKNAIEARGKFTLSLEKNKEKAELMEKKLRKYFE